MPQDSKRVKFNALYERMTPEGFYSEQAFTISLLRNKQGEWKIADID
ncbi:hypothetical protein PaeBR_13200 [Paenibacillus sp. BR2-3]